jgi:hypothetical protein
VAPAAAAVDAIDTPVLEAEYEETTMQAGDDVAALVAYAYAVKAADGARKAADRWATDAGRAVEMVNELERPPEDDGSGGKLFSDGNRYGADYWRMIHWELSKTGPEGLTTPYTTKDGEVLDVGISPSSVREDYRLLNERRQLGKERAAALASGTDSDAVDRDTRYHGYITDKQYFENLDILIYRYKDIEDTNRRRFDAWQGMTQEEKGKIAEEVRVFTDPPRTPLDTSRGRVRL